MEMKLGYTGRTGSGWVKFGLVYLCFIIFGAMIALSKPEFKILTLAFSLLLSLVVGLLSVYLLIMIFNAINTALRESSISFASEAVGNGMLFMIPFTVLAVLAKFLLGWDALMPFASAAIMTAMATAGTEVMKKGAQGIKNVLFPSVLAFVLSSGWMMLISILP